MGLIIPLPFVVKRKLFTFISESPIIAKLQYGLKVSRLLAPKVLAFFPLEL
jgi:B-cell receptor-associated protein 31